MGLQYHVPGTEPPKRPEDAPHSFVYEVHACADGGHMGAPLLYGRSDYLYETAAQAEEEAKRMGGDMCTARVVQRKVYLAPAAKEAPRN